MREQNFRHWLALFPCLLILSSISSVKADIDWDLHGFGTLSGAYMDDDAMNQTGSTEINEFERGVQYDVDSKLALQGSLHFNPQFSFTAQAVAPAIDDFEPEIEWGYLSWWVSDALIIRTGRLRRPNYLYSDNLRVGYTYPWVRPPSEVYSRDSQFFASVDAINALYNWTVDDWHFEFETYFGKSSRRADFIAGQSVKTSTRNDFGIFLSMEYDWLNLRFGYQQLPDSTIDTISSVQPLYDGLNVAGFGDIVDDLEVENKQIEYFNFASGIDYDDWLMLFEYIYIPVENSIAPDETSWYLTTGRRFGKWTLHYTYAERKRNNRTDFSAPVREQAALIAPVNPAAAGGLNFLADSIDTTRDLLAIDNESHYIGLRYDFDNPVAIKAELQQINDKRNGYDSELFSVALDFFF